MSTKAVDLYELLPTVYRLRDAERGYPLKALLEIVAGQVDIVKRDMDGLWDDLFIETCADWVIPYIGDLVGNNPLYDVELGLRADVAKTIYYRRRKGVLPMLEELARDVTGWGAHAVAAFEHLGWTQNVNHVRYTLAPDPEERFPYAFSRVGTVNLRHMDAVDRLDGPFDTLSHSVDVRPADQVVGRYNIRKINFFLWRLQQFPLTLVPAREAAAFANGFHLGPLRYPAPLFTNPEREAAETELATELHVPGPIRPCRFLFQSGRLLRAGPEPGPLSPQRRELAPGPPGQDLVQGPVGLEQAAGGQDRRGRAAGPLRLCRRRGARPAKHRRQLQLWLQRGPGRRPLRPHPNAARFRRRLPPHPRGQRHAGRSRHVAGRPGRLGPGAAPQGRDPDPGQPRLWRRAQRCAAGRQPPGRRSGQRLPARSCGLWGAGASTPPPTPRRRSRSTACWWKAACRCAAKWT